MPQKETVRYSTFQNVEIPEKTFSGHGFCQSVFLGFPQRGFPWVSHKDFIGFPTKRVSLGFRQRLEKCFFK